MQGVPPMQGVSPMQPMMNQQPMQPIMNQQPMIQGVPPMMNQQPMQPPMMNQPQMMNQQQQQVSPMAQQQPMQQQPQQPQNQVVYPPQQGGLPVPNLGAIMQGGFLPSSFPGQGGMIVVDTSGGAMAAEGLGQMAPMGGRRTRASYQGGAMQGPPSMPSMPSMPAGGFQHITINKME